MGYTANCFLSSLIEDVINEVEAFILQRKAIAAMIILNIEGK